MDRHHAMANWATIVKSQNGGQSLIKIKLKQADWKKIIFQIILVNS